MRWRQPQTSRSCPSIDRLWLCVNAVCYTTGLGVEVSMCRPVLPRTAGGLPVPFYAFLAAARFSPTFFQLTISQMAFT